MFDLIVKNGTVIDGTGAAGFRADVAVNGDQIVGVAVLPDAAAVTEIDATGHVVAPGFIDVHNHSDGWLLREPNFTPKTLQGFTTEIIMADGIGYAPVDRLNARQWMYYLQTLDGLRMRDYRGWESFEQFLALFEGRTSQNVASHLPYANLRALACGFGRVAVDDFQIREIQRQIRIGMEAGAVGISTGLDYIVQCFSTTDELAETLSAMSPYDGLYVTHIRYKKGLLPALAEAVAIGRRADVRVHISHLKGQSPCEVEQVLEFLDAARRDVDITFDVYPYQPGSTMLNYLVPYEVWQDGPLAAASHLVRPEMLAKFAAGLEAYRLPLERIRLAWTAGREHSGLHGRSLAEIIAEAGKPAADVLTDLLLADRFAPLLVFDEGDDSLVEPFLRHDLFMLGSDGIYCEGGHMHPRVFGSAGRMLGPMVRDRGLFSLEHAVAHMSGVPAKRFGFERRGTIAAGQFADLVVFDPDTVIDRATYESPRQTTVGIHHVIVNGVSIVASAGPCATESPPGRVLS